MRISILADGGEEHNTHETADYKNVAVAAVAVDVCD